MGKQLIINAIYEIAEGVTHGFKGRLVAYNACVNKAEIQVEENLIINTNSENLILVDERFVEMVKEMRGLFEINNTKKYR